MAETLAVIGGGVVGLNVALALQREGFAVTVYDRDEGSGNDTLGASHLSLIHISEPTRQEAISYAVFCLKKKKK